MSDKHLFSPYAPLSQGSCPALDQFIEFSTSRSNIRFAPLTSRVLLSEPFCPFSEFATPISQSCQRKGAPRSYAHRLRIVAVGPSGWCGSHRAMDTILQAFQLRQISRSRKLNLKLKGESARLNLMVLVLNWVQADRRRVQYLRRWNASTARCQASKKHQTT
ncbi:hypothetical protein BV22DRAFT_755893 [Leucogyrophana mollusca]|uniref:Uncharacterized protein n=1 Tax=Leucogyrophana mollusca TaxID=85980 RepID=A0ACB8B5M3_9AGAM|nr:hypothetical protein BV22DRAFT_755893 [Leucogyrophana mollusca]